MERSLFEISVIIVTQSRYQPYCYVRSIDFTNYYFYSCYHQQLPLIVIAYFTIGNFLAKRYSCINKLIFLCRYFDIIFWNFSIFLRMNQNLSHKVIAYIMNSICLTTFQEQIPDYRSMCTTITTLFKDKLYATLHTSNRTIIWNYPSILPYTYLISISHYWALSENRHQFKLGQIWMQYFMEAKRFSTLKDEKIVLRFRRSIKLDLCLYSLR